MANKVKKEQLKQQQQQQQQHQGQQMYPKSVCQPQQQQQQQQQQQLPQHGQMPQQPHHQQAIQQQHVQNGQQMPLFVCQGCRKPIKDRYMLNALNSVWHEDCLKCSCCDCRLGEVGNKLFEKSNLLLCQRDYLRLFGPTGKCSVCHQQIPGFEQVMKAKGHIFHIECFSCSSCSMKFCIGDRYHIHEGKILCQYDFNKLALSSSGRTSKMQ